MPKRDHRSASCFTHWGLSVATFHRQRPHPSFFVRLKLAAKNLPSEDTEAATPNRQTRPPGMGQASSLGKGLNLLTAYGIPIFRKPDQVIYWTAAAGAATAADVYGADVLSALKEAGGAAVSDVLATLRGPRKSVRIHLLETIADALEKVKRGGSRGCRMLKSSNNNDVSNCADAVPSLRAARPPGAVNKPGVDCYSMACRTKNGGKK